MPSLLPLLLLSSLKVYFGLLHAHTWYSDGSGTPDAAFARAKEKGAHFFAVTPHNHEAAESGAKERMDGLLVATRHELYDSSGELTFERVWKENGASKRKRYSGQRSVIRAATERTDATFVAFYGQEFSTISSGNHVNVFDYPSVLTADGGAYRDLYEILAASGEAYVVQLNHPDVHADLFYSGSDPETKQKMFNDYGFDDYKQDFAQLVAAAGRFVVLCEMLSGPAMKKKRIADFRYRHHEDDYYFYLVQGFHLSPSVGHDNHYETFGDATDARMGVWAETLTRAKLLEAMRANRTFATEDESLAIQLEINGQPMGSVLTLEADAPLDVRITVQDSNEAGAEYDVMLVYGDVEPQDRTSLVEWRARDGELEEVSREGNGTISIPGYVASGRAEFYYVRVTQSGNQRAWSAPIWINHARPISSGGFVWSKRSKTKIFHDPDCKVVKTISANNRTTGKPPEGWTQHDCRVVEGDGH
jgi:hypothetical protein